MSKKTYLLFYFSDGKKAVMTWEEALTYSAENNAGITRPRPDFEGNASGAGRVRDRWEPGWDHGLGQYVGSMRERKEIMKRKGFEEFGSGPPPARVRPKRERVNDSLLKEVSQQCGEITGNQAKLIKEKFNRAPTTKK